MEKLGKIRKMRQLKNRRCPGLDVSLVPTEFCELQLAEIHVVTHNVAKMEVSTTTKQVIVETISI